MKPAFDLTLTLVVDTPIEDFIDALSKAAASAKEEGADFVTIINAKTEYNPIINNKIIGLLIAGWHKEK
jgi:hypothetical protein